MGRGLKWGGESLGTDPFPPENRLGVIVKKITNRAGRETKTKRAKPKRRKSYYQPKRNKVTLLAQAPTVNLRQWRELAACRDSDPDLFFPIGTTGPAIEQIEEARAICRACIVREDCLQFSLNTNQEAGVWGGYAEDERRRLRKRWLAERRRAAS